MVRCHHGSQGASFAVSSCAVGLTLGPLVFVLPRQAPGLNSSPTPVNPTLWQLMVTTRPDCLCPGWTQLRTEFSQAVYFLSHGDVLGSPASFKRFCDSLGVLPLPAFRRPVDLYAAHSSLHLSYTDIRSYSLSG